MNKRIIWIAFVLFGGMIQVKSQINYGTTGLMNMPTADMQHDKTFMAGGNWLSRHVTVPRWWYDTWNYYINITIFLGWKQAICVRGIRLSTLIMETIQVIGSLPLTASSRIKIALFISGLEYGRKDGGNCGHHRLC